jgi:hypothetical protein
VPEDGWIVVVDGGKQNEEDEVKGVFGLGTYSGLRSMLLVSTNNVAVEEFE